MSIGEEQFYDAEEEFIEAEVEEEEEEAEVVDDDNDNIDGRTDDHDDEERSEPVAVAAVEVQAEDQHEDDDESMLEDHTMGTENVEEEDEITVKSHGTQGTHATEEDGASTASRAKSTKSTPASGKRTTRKSSLGSGAKKGRTPSVAGLTIPFRTVKKAMKLDPDIPIVQNEAAIMTTVAAELFLKKLAKESFRNAKNRGRNTVKYEDVAEARTKNPALAFLEPLLP